MRKVVGNPVVVAHTSGKMRKVCQVWSSIDIRLNYKHSNETKSRAFVRRYIYGDIGNNRSIQKNVAFAVLNCDLEGKLTEVLGKLAASKGRKLAFDSNTRIWVVGTELMVANLMMILYMRGAYLTPSNVYSFW